MKKLIRKYLIPTVTGTIIFVVFLPLSLFIENEIVRMVIAEILRGVGTLLLGITFNVGIAISSIYENIDCYTTQGITNTLLLISMVVSTHLILGTLWDRYRWKGGIVATLLSGIWLVAVHNPDYWVLPSIGFALSGMFLIRGQIFNSPQIKEMGSKA